MRNIHIAVVGAGIVGLAVAYHLIKEGAQVTLIDRDPEGDSSSLGNAGGIAVTEVVPASAPGSLWRVFGWMLDPLGPLAVRPTHAPKLIPWLCRFAQVGTQSEVDRISKALAAINSRVYEDLLPMLSETGLASELNRNGSLSLYESDAGYHRDAAEWACKRSHGIDIQELTGEEAPAHGARARTPSATRRFYAAMVACQRSQAPGAGLESLAGWARCRDPPRRGKRHHIERFRGAAQRSVAKRGARDRR